MRNGKNVFALLVDIAPQPVSKAEQKTPETSTKQMAKVQLEFVGPKLTEIFEGKEVPNSVGPPSTYQDSFSSSRDTPRPAPQSPSTHDGLSPKERA